MFQRIKEKHIYVSVIIFITILCHVFSLVLTQLKLHNFLVPPSWIYQFYILLGSSLCLSLLLRIVKKTGSIILITLSTIVILLIIGFPLGSYLGVEFLLLISSLLNIGFCLVTPFNYLYSFAVLILVIALQSPAAIWENTVAGPSSHDIFILAVISLAFIFIVCNSKFFLERVAQKENRLKHLNEVTLKLSRANTSFQQYVNIAGKQSEMNERKRITREIHDTLGYTMTNIMMMVEAASDLIDTDKEKSKTILANVLLQAREGHQETRRALHLLRKKDAFRFEGIIREVHKLTDAFHQATNVDVKVEYGNIPWSFGDIIDLTVFRFIQEGMTNALTHGKANEIKISFWLDNNLLFINLHDNGSGSNEIKEGIGLKGMRERIEKLEGKFVASNVIDGFQISAWIPRNDEINQ